MTAFWVFLALLVGAVACRVAWTRGHARGELDSATDAYARGHRDARREAWEQDQRTENARLAMIRENHSAGARQAWETRKAQRAARGES